MMNTHGAPKLVATTSSVTNKAENISRVNSAKVNSVLIAKVIGIQEFLVKKSDYKEMLVTSIRSSTNLWKDKSINNAQIASSGFQKMKDVITWPVDANMNFVINVEENIRLVNAWKQLNEEIKIIIIIEELILIVVDVVVVVVEGDYFNAIFIVLKLE